MTTCLDHLPPRTRHIYIHFRRLQVSAHCIRNTQSVKGVTEYKTDSVKHLVYKLCHLTIYSAYFKISANLSARRNTTPFLCTLITDCNALPFVVYVSNAFNGTTLPKHVAHLRDSSHAYIWLDLGCLNKRGRTVYGVGLWNRGFESRWRTNVCLLRLVAGKSLFEGPITHPGQSYQMCMSHCVWSHATIASYTYNC